MTTEINPLFLLDLRMVSAGCAFDIVLIFRTRSFPSVRNRLSYFFFIAIEILRMVALANASGPSPNNTNNVVKIVINGPLAGGANIANICLVILHFEP